MPSDEDDQELGVQGARPGPLLSPPFLFLLSSFSSPLLSSALLASHLLCSPLLFFPPLSATLSSPVDGRNARRLRCIKTTRCEVK